MHVIEFTKLHVGSLFSSIQAFFFFAFQTASLGPKEFLEARLSLALDMKLLTCFQTSGWFNIEGLDKNSLPSVQFLTDVLCRHEKALYVTSLLKFPIQKKE